MPQLRKRIDFFPTMRYSLAEKKILSKYFLSNKKILYIIL